MLDAATSALARLGDLRVAAAVVEMAASPWRRRKELGAQHVAILVELAGLPAFARILGVDAPDGDWAEALRDHGATPAIRRVGVRLQHAAGVSPIAALGDPDLEVARIASHLLVERGDDAELLVELDALLGDPPHFEAALDRRARLALWILLTLHRRGADVRSRHAELGVPRYPIDLPEDVRAAILREYVPQAQPGTDPALGARARPRRPRASAGRRRRARGSARASSGRGGCARDRRRSGGLDRPRDGAGRRHLRHRPAPTAIPRQILDRDCWTGRPGNPTNHGVSRRPSFETIRGCSPQFLSRASRTMSRGGTAGELHILAAASSTRVAPRSAIRWSRATDQARLAGATGAGSTRPQT